MRLEGGREAGRATVARQGRGDRLRSGSVSAKIIPVNWMS